MPDGQRAATKAAETQAESNLLRDRVTAAVGDLYLIEQEVGRGGMAVVYAAEDVRLQRPVALKVLPPELAFRGDVRERFVREAQTAARLNHPHIVPIYAVHEEGGLVCFAMALVKGESLAARIVRDPRPGFEYIAQMLEQVADALAYAHACGVVHRDVKPDNVLIDKDSGRAMVTDFGIARAAESGSRLTQTGIAVGTPAFMSPEQATGDREIDGRSDIYSLGVVGYLMLAGRLPFEATTTPAMLMKHVSETPMPIRAVRPDAPHALVEILERCLAKRPQDRWDNAMQLRDALRKVQRDGSLQTGAHRAYAPPAPAPLYPPAAAPVHYNGTSGARTPEHREDARYGQRSEDWAPRNVLVPAPAPRSYPAPGALPPMPALPPLPPGAPREQVREWNRASKEAMQDWRVAVRQQRRDVQSQWNDQYGDATSAWRSDEDVIERFKGQMLWTAGMIVFLGVINASTSPGFPWAIFPSMGMGLGVLGRYIRLRRRGITLGRIFGGESTPKPDGDPRSKPARIADASRAFVKHAKWLMGAAAVSLGSLVIGASLDLKPMIIPMLGAGLAALASAQMLARDFMRLRRLGVSAGDAWNGSWQAIAAGSDDRPYEVKMREQLALVAGDQLLASAYGELLRNAVDDRLTIKDVTAKLSDADKSLVPDVEPTADALLERISALASGLERLQRDLPTDALTQLESRVASVQAEPEQAPDRERRLTLLTRQLSSLQELVDRRETMQRQLDSASMALRSLRLDIVKLRTMGVGAAINDVTNATQEARALSRDLGHVISAADEMRKL
ncbi:protein kinase domain-containing protein [Gemmatimonas groenlandica]|uniref:non-specific serine/threonine protein kinase n=1 Tax=Gemmatimonas groenlandica TaxID=2732249 RepID=A0A6M4ITL3_9BACT|nr:protein kinase [Gemmatimonas groenlandica]QJR38020.1 protein kinase [Gemmatimonas groenlandica]